MSWQLFRALAIFIVTCGLGTVLGTAITQTFEPGANALQVSMYISGYLRACAFALVGIGAAAIAAVSRER